MNSTELTDESFSVKFQKNVTVVSYFLVAATLLLVMLQGLLPGLLCLCIGFLCTRSIARGLLWLRLHFSFKITDKFSSNWHAAQIFSAAIIIASPLVLLTFALSHSKTFVLHAPEQYRELLDHTARTVLELREKLPLEMANHLPAGVADVQLIVANYLKAQAGSLALTGKAWLHTLLFSYVGLIIGSLAGCSVPPVKRFILAHQIHKRICIFGDTFSQIVAAQFWIAGFNMILTAFFLIVVLPIWDIKIPYTPALVTLTFVAGLVPIVGNLLCNAVITIAGLSVSPAAAVACLIFLVFIHKSEYIINAKVVGARTQMSVWELLTAMFVSEAVFGSAGLVAAPLFYAYVKKEMMINKLV